MARRRASTLALLHELPTTRPVGTISNEALECLRAHPWPGNIAELEQVISRALALGKGEQIELRDLPAALQSANLGEHAEDSPARQFALALAERHAIERAMRLVRGQRAHGGAFAADRQDHAVSALG